MSNEYLSASVMLPTIRPVVNPNRTILSVVLATWHCTVESEPHAVASHAVSPQRPLGELDSKPKPPPKTVTLDDPVRGTLSLDPLTSLLVS
eukprot:CAMPEP_0181334620 /NCGR_PEP_ID=MMETSP1101-20121128/26368_1 /TAXON_ID=46948 /ORGANISM="Rhodomonas abbreviata, Strain Caron Lab Isolate" /LENGTH=90 /DNA_ID=CAMNT_0023444631 /DNA_START=211 /DNA_END=480 /DNA_ORIENTATION=+